MNLFTSLACLFLGVSLMTSLPAPPPAPSPAHQNYNSATISIDLSQEEGNSTLLAATEHGDADYLIVEAFYWTDLGGKFQGKKYLLHKEITTPLSKGQPWAADIPLALTDIAFIRVKEVKLKNVTEFGREKEPKP